MRDCVKCMVCVLCAGSLAPLSGMIGMTNLILYKNQLTGAAAVFGYNLFAQVGYY